jgi:hypothetical protein
MDKPESLLKAWQAHKAAARTLRNEFIATCGPGTRICWMHGDYKQFGVVQDKGGYSHLIVINEKTKREVFVDIYSVLQAHYPTTNL